MKAEAMGKGVFRNTFDRANSQSLGKRQKAWLERNFCTVFLEARA